ncbi:hypothetical protein TNCV_5083201 [Trichonephila clavipes]|nr:hypothetical protein TNCV_5083201 [Trichonephila clavipes]
MLNHGQETRMAPELVPPLITTTQHQPEDFELSTDLTCIAPQPEVDYNDFRELLDSHNHELVTDGLIEMHEFERDVEELESVDPGQLEDRMTVDNLTYLSLIEKGLQTLEKHSAKKSAFFNKTRNKKIMKPIFQQGIPTLYGMDIHKVELLMDKVSSQTPKSTAAA